MLAQYRCNVFIPNCEHDVVSISPNAKHESCRYIPYGSIAFWITSIGAWMRELYPNYKVVSKLSRITQLNCFAINVSIYILNQNIKIMSIFRHQISIKY